MRWPDLRVAVAAMTRAPWGRHGSGPNSSGVSICRDRGGDLVCSVLVSVPVPIAGDHSALSRCVANADGIIALRNCASAMLDVLDVTRLLLSDNLTPSRLDAALVALRIATAELDEILAGRQR